MKTGGSGVPIKPLQTSSRILVSLKVSSTVLKDLAPDSLIKEAKLQIVGKPRSKIIPRRQLAQIVQHVQEGNYLCSLLT